MVKAENVTIEAHLDAVLRSGYCDDYYRRALFPREVKGKALVAIVVRGDTFYFERSPGAV